MKTITFIGAGAMSEALIRGWASFTQYRICVMNATRTERLYALRDQYGVTPCDTDTSRIAALNQSDIVILACKPKDALQALTIIAPALPVHAVLVSVVAGLSLATLQQPLHLKQPIVRTMPNTSTSIGWGVTAWCSNHFVSEDKSQEIVALFEAVGLMHPVAEHQMNAITALSGSGPAYIYLLMEAMIDCATTLGFAVPQAQQLVAQTVAGAALTVLQTDTHPRPLREAVTSPQGTTAAALTVLRPLPELLHQAIQAAIERAEQLQRNVL